MTDHLGATESDTDGGVSESPGDAELLASADGEPSADGTTDEQPSVGFAPRVDPASLRFASLAATPELAEVATAIERDLPPFLAELTRAHRDRASAHYATTSWVVLEDGLPVGVVRAVPWSWSGASAEAPTGGVGEVAAGLDALDPDVVDTLAVLDVVVAFGARGRGIGRAVLDGLDTLRVEQGYDRLLVLLRPHTKRDYPLVPFQRYASFVRTDGAPFDSWFRAAWQAGLVPVAAAERSLSARAPFDSWQRWLGVEVPGSGPYLVDGAIKPAILETELDEGRYREPHLWAGRGAAVRPAGGRSWLEVLLAAGVIAGDRRHREVKPRR